MKDSRECLLVRADASPQIGHGHALRCLALAQAWQQSNGRAVFAMASSSEAIDRRLRESGAEWRRIASVAGTMDDAQETARLASQENAAWVVLDGYRFGTGYQQIMRGSPARLLCLDDDGRHGRYETDIILNQNPSAEPGMYGDRLPAARLLLGPEHALLRREFAAITPPERRALPVARKVLVTLGGADPDNATLTVIRALQTFVPGEIEAVVLVGGSNPHRTELERALPDSGAIRLIFDAPDMPAWMSWADVALSAAGSTIYELAFFGVPMLLLVLADNQAPGARRMAELGAARHLGVANELTAEEIARALRAVLQAPEERAALSAAARKLVDGRGASRVVQAMRQSLRLREATIADERLLFDLANEPEVRAASFSSDPIPWEDHQCWFRRKLTQPESVVLVAENFASIPAGVVRFDIAEGVATISIALAAAFRGQGHGAALVDLASRRIFQRPEVQAVRALVKPANAASVRAFTGAGFIEDSAKGPRDALSFTLFRRLP